MSTLLTSCQNYMRGGSRNNLEVVVAAVNRLITPYLDLLAQIDANPEHAELLAEVKSDASEFVRPYLEFLAWAEKGD